MWSRLDRVASGRVVLLQLLQLLQQHGLHAFAPPAVAVAAAATVPPPRSSSFSGLRRFSSAPPAHKCLSALYAYALVGEGLELWVRVVDLDHLALAPLTYQSQHTNHIIVSSHTTVAKCSPPPSNHHEP